MTLTINNILYFNNMVLTSYREHRGEETMDDKLSTHDFNNENW